MRLSDFNPISNSSSLMAAELLANKDLVYADGGSDGKGRKVSLSNNAAIGNVDLGTAITSAATGQVVPQTSIVAAQTIAYSRQAVVNNAKGEIFALCGTSSVSLSKFSPSGSMVAQVVLASTASSSNHHILLLSNGNIACVFFGPTTINVAIYDSNLAVVKSLTSIGSSNNIYFSAISLSAGGFAIVYQDSSAQLTSKITTYDNSGNVVLSPTTIWTRTGTYGIQYHRAIQLSNGNIAIAISSTNTVSSIGLYYGIISTAASVVSAFASLDTVSAGWFPEIAIRSGFFAISRANGANQKAYVFNNSGVLQGSEFSYSTTAGNAHNKTKLLSDGIDFWLIWHRNSDSQCVASILPITGNNDRSQPVTTNPSQYNHYLDAFIENGLICGISMAGIVSSAPSVWVISIKSGTLLNGSATLFGVAPSSGNGSYPRVMPGGDRSFIAMYDYASSASTNLFVGKYAKTAIIGVAQNSADADTSVKLYSQAGSYETNEIVGTPSGFDHSTNSVVGNKGSILPFSVTLKGIGV